ncbi:MAG: Calx-beta domain-containing protein [Verrucomicrobiia bacterium]
MKVTRFLLGVGLCICLTTVMASFVFSQTSSGGTFPGPYLVGIHALDPTGSEPGNDTASFRVYRTGDNTYPLTIAYSISGTASNGVDYQRIPDSITIPSGADSAIITITPIDDNLIEPTETVILTLKESTAYKFDINPDGIMAYRAYVRIFDNETNQLPKIAIIQPTNDSIFQLPTNIVIKAEATDEDGVVQKVGFFANKNLLGYVYNENNTKTVFSFVWQNPPAGEFVLTARAYDNAGTESESEPILITIKQQLPERDVVSVYVVDGEAEEIPPVPPGMGMPQRINNGVVRFHRSGPTNFPLYVNYSLSGTAINGVDYQLLTGNIVIPQGQREANLEIIPIYDNIKEDTETVVIRVEPPVCIAIYPPPPDCYVVGQPSEATVKILDSASNSTNSPPSVVITKPEHGSVFTAPANVIISAEASDKDGFIKTVEFWANNKRLCIITNYPESMRPINPFIFVWTNVAAGEYTLSAIATDNQEARAYSAPVRIYVRAPTNQIPVVTITATDPEASELPPIVDAFNPGVFTVRRTGPLDSALLVHYKISGTASNGVDYNKLAGTVEIPAGSSSADIQIIPIDDDIIEGTEYVTLTLVVPEVIITIYPPPPPPYIIGEPGRATVFIYDNEVSETNIPPRIKITRPRNETTFIAPANIGLCAEARDIDGKIARVEFYEGTNKLGEAISPTNNLSVLYPYYFLWRNVGAGEYTLTAIATDDKGASSTSEPVKIRVVPPVTNITPIVRIEAIDAYASEGPITPIIIYSNYNTTANSGDPEVITTRIPAINTATFVVRRDGPTNSELTVYYAISGTASNGVDYLPLPGVVVIPEGERKATITIIPIDDSIREGLETVILTLIPPVTPQSTNEQTNPSDGASNNSTKPPYLIGIPNRASAVIADNDIILPPPIKLPDGQFHFSKPAPTGMVYILETSSDLINWTPIITNVVEDGTINYVDTESTDYKRRFYRITPLQQ